MKKILRIAAAASMIAPLLTSCNHQELCFDHWDHTARHQVNFQAEWDRQWHYHHPEIEGAIHWESQWQNYDFTMSYDDLRPERGTGIRSQVYTDGHDNELRNLPPEGGIVHMTAGEHQLLFYNNDTEYIVFNDMEFVANASATTRTRSRSTYIGNSKAPATRGDEVTVNAPDKLFAKYIESYTAEKVQEAPIENITLRPLVFRYLIRYHFSGGLEYVRLARGALAGMAGSVFLNDGHTGMDPVTVLFDADINDWGVETVVNTFGVPNFPNLDYTRAEFYGLNLEVLLRNGILVNFDFDVTDQILKQPRGGVIDVYNVVIPEDLANEEDKGAFGVAIEGWGDFEDVSFDLGGGKK